MKLAVVEGPKRHKTGEYITGYVQNLSAPAATILRLATGSLGPDKG